MEYLVTMTTHVPDGTSEGAVQHIRTREAARSGQLATQGHLLRLWRPPLQPGEWRTLGLFAADDGDQLEEVLASMPLRVWRTDEVTPLSPHPNDPARQTEKPGTLAPGPGNSEFLTTFTVAVPADTAPDTVDATTQREADRARELAAQGYLVRLWTLPGQSRALGLWQAPDSAGMNGILASLPLSRWVSVQTTPLTRHPSDPALTSG
ncbi:MAG: muconolactone Delta-isomerase family protein [Acidimicrobiales bacterium]